MATILIGGGSGLIGQRLSTMLLEKGHDVIILSRKIKEPAQPHLCYALWNPDKHTIDINAIAKSDYIINLAGEGVADKRWTKKRKKILRESRTKSCALIVHTLRNNANKIKAVINASGIGWYGDDTNNSKQAFTEDMPAANDFLGETCKAWEESIAPVTALGKRLVIIRTGIVLSKEGGALPAFIKPVRFGFAPVLGNGKQIQSWIHIDDICRMYIHALENESVQGAYNAAAPKPVDIKELVTTLAKKMKGSFYIPIYVPSFLLKIILGELSTEVLKSITVSSTRIRNTGFQFIFPSIEAAVNDVI
ncbi:MAG: TIGR01777 family protein [Chitinophagaceae bacterium]|nr:TIGR01777 family protein [Chitinophagaceae bacterium]